MNVEQIEQRVVEIMGEKPLHMERMTYGHANTVYNVVLPDKEIIVRANENPHVMKRRLKIYPYWRSSGFPFPASFFPT